LYERRTELRFGYLAAYADEVDTGAAIHPDLPETGGVVMALVSSDRQLPAYGDGPGLNPLQQRH
jgi:hypothetical protein